MSSALDSLGPHLLGRRPSPADARDWQLAQFLASDADLVAQALAELEQTTVGYKNRNWTVPPPASHWAKGLALLAQVTPPPPAGPPVSAVEWADTEPVLDQGQTGHCVGFGGAQWGNTLPVDDKYANADGDAIYYECKVIDGEPLAEDGSDVRSLAKALQARGRLGSYAFAATVDESCAWVMQHGPVIWGTDWRASMFTPDAQGFVTLAGAVAGGHCYAQVGYDPAADALKFVNSWGAGWGQNGRFLMRKADAVALFASQGEALAATELP
jgi:hypothetical protein